MTVQIIKQIAKYLASNYIAVLRRVGIAVILVLIGRLMLAKAPGLWTTPSPVEAQSSVTLVEAENLGAVTYGGGGWGTYSSSDASGSYYRGSGHAGDTATLTFTGVSVSVLLMSDCTAGAIEVAMDGVAHPSITPMNNAACDGPDFSEVVIATDLSPVQHTLVITATGQPSFDYIDHPSGFIGIDAFRYGDFPFATVEGRVLDPDRDGLRYATVTLNNGSRAWTVAAGHDGVFTLSGLPAGTLSITASKSNYTSQTVGNIAVTAGTVTSVDVTIPEAAGHVLHGRIHAPRANSPVIRRVGERFQSIVKEDAGADDWTAFLSTAYDTIPLPIVEAIYDPITAWTVTATIPTGIPEELYDLTVQSTAGSYTEPRAVQVVKAYRDPFYFVVLGDPQDATVEPGRPTFRRIVDEINIINPALVLVVGDLVENSTTSEFAAYLAATNQLRVPIYSIPGNHDVGSVGSLQFIPLWKQHVGRRFYSFDYDDYHFVGMDNSMLHSMDPARVDVGHYFADQVAWAQADLAAHQSSALRLAFLHITLNAGYCCDSLPEWKPSWMDALQVNMVLSGHASSNQAEIEGSTPVHWVETDDMIRAQYRLVRIGNGAIVSYNYNGAGTIPSGELEVDFSPANDGAYPIVSAAIGNQLYEHFEHALLRFVMPRGQCYATTAGTITQMVNSDDGRITLVYVTLDIPARSDTVVMVGGCNMPPTFAKSVSRAKSSGGYPLVYTISITNPNLLEGFANGSITDGLPPDTTYSAGPTCDIGSCRYISASETITWSGNIPARSTLHLSYTAMVNNGLANGTQITNTAFVSMAAKTGWTNVVTTTIFDPPVATNDSYSVNEDTTLNVSAAGVLTNDTVYNGNSLTAIKVSGPAHGTLTLNANGSFAYVPAPNYYGPDSFTYKANDGAADSNVATVNITVNSVNDPPSFTKGPGLTANEDAGAQTVTGWATNISPGPNESGQTLTFIITGDTNPALFAAGPAVAPNGTLTFSPVPNASGSATITIVLRDNGGTANGGVDASAPQSFVITVNPVNDPPSFTKGADQTMNEGAGAQTVTGWATNISPGPNESGQTLTFTITGNTNPALFAAGPAVAPNGTLTFTPAPNVFGSATITIVLRDNGGTANGGVDASAPQSFAITVNPVNDPPSFTKGADQAVNEGAGAQTVTGWATNISPGPNESGQTLTFTITGNTNPALFAAGPAVAPNGTLTFSPVPNVFGSATITIVLCDNGGTANGGVDASAPQSFAIAINRVNDPPWFVSTPVTVATPGVTYTYAIVATDPDVVWGDALTITVLLEPVWITLTDSGNGTAILSGIPANTHAGDYYVILQVCDMAGATSTQTFTITVMNVIYLPLVIRNDAAWQPKEASRDRRNHPSVLPDSNLSPTNRPQLSQICYSFPPLLWLCYTYTHIIPV